MFAVGCWSVCSSVWMQQAAMCSVVVVLQRRQHMSPRLDQCCRQHPRCQWSWWVYWLRPRHRRGNSHTCFWHCPHSMQSRVYVTVGHPSICLVSSFVSRCSVWQVCCCVPHGQDILINGCGRRHIAATAPQHGVRQQMWAVSCWQPSCRGWTQLICVWSANSPYLNSVDYSVWGDIATDGVSSQNFIHWSAELRANGLLGSAKPGHIELSNRSVVKKTDDSYQGEGCPYWISCGLTVCLQCFDAVGWAAGRASGL